MCVCVLCVIICVIVYMCEYRCAQLYGGEKTALSPATLWDQEVEPRFLDLCASTSTH